MFSFIGDKTRSAMCVCGGGGLSLLPVIIPLSHTHPHVFPHSPTPSYRQAHTHTHRRTQAAGSIEQNNSVYISHISGEAFSNTPSPTPSTITSPIRATTPTSGVCRLPFFLICAVFLLLCILLGAPLLGTAHVCVPQTNKQRDKQTGTQNSQKYNNAVPANF